MIGSMFAALLQTAPSADQVKASGEVIAENGRVLATLDDWRAIVFVLVVVIIILAVERFFASAGMRAERRDMAAERERMWQVADKFGQAADKLVVQLQVAAALWSRVEAALGRCEDKLGD